MAINARDFLCFAETCPEDNEASIRSSMSRAYYAAYHSCNEFYRASASNVNVTGGVHESLIRSLINSPEKKDKATGYLLRQLKGFRVEADYDLNRDISCDGKKEAILISHKILERVDDAFASVGSSVAGK